MLFIRVKSKSLSSLGITLDETVTSDPILQIPFSAVASSISWNTAPATATGFNRWLTAILQKVADTDNADTSSNNATVQQPSKRLTSNRAGTPVIAYSYAVTVYVPDTLAGKPDGDDL